MSENPFAVGSNRKVISVSDLNRMARQLLEGAISLVHVEGEVSNLSLPASGHWYFTLKDDKAQLRVAMFRNRNRAIKTPPKNGALVIVRGGVGLYEARGEYQLIAEHLEESGEGALRQALVRLQERLSEEGLFEKGAKQELPPMPKHLGIITSRSGAALHDVLSVLKRRFPPLACTLLPVPVQGEGAADQLVAAIEQANRYRTRPFDLLLLTRGGGSLEDLWPFNEEKVARAIFAGRIPLVSAVGHEIDFTTADLVADQRAPTPSAAAEMISPDVEDWLRIVADRERSLLLLLRQKLQDARQQVEAGRRRLRHPRRRLEELHQTVDRLQLRLARQLRRQLRQYEARLQLEPRLQAGLQRRLQTTEERIERLVGQVRKAGLQLLESRSAAVASAGRALNAVSPLAVLERGYSVTLRDGKAVREAAELQTGDEVRMLFAKGAAEARVTSLHPEEDA